MRKFLLTFSLLLYSFLWAQDPFYIRYSTADGLPSSNVYSVFTEDNGKLWLTTDAGLVKYDSHTFTLVNSDNGLSDNEVFQMKKDYLGRIWMLTLSGKTCYLYNNKIYNQSNSKLVQAVSGSSVMLDFYQAPDHTIYFQFRDREITILKPNGKIRRLNGAKIFGPDIKKIRSEFFFLKTCGVLDQIHPLFAPFHPESNSYRSYHYKGKNYFSMGDGLYQITAQKQIVKIATIPDKTEIIQMYQESRDKLWVCTRNGLYLFENQVLVKKYFTHQSISYITQDFEGGYWISTLKNGVLYVPSFEVFTDYINHPLQAKFNCVGIGSNQDLWVGGDDNTYYHKTPNSSFSKYRLLSNDGLPDQISRIRFMNGNTYIVGKKLIEKISKDGQRTSLGFGGNDYFQDDKNYFVAYNYTFKVSKKIGSEARLVHFIYDSIFINKRTTVFAQDAHKNTWIGTNYGLYLYNASGKTQKWFDVIPELQSSILDLFYDAENDFLVIATSSKGLFFIRNNQILQHITRRDGLNSITCNSIKKLNNHYYLIGSNNGINSVLIRKNHFEVKNLNALLGLKNKKINDIEASNNTIYSATDEGLLYFDIQKIRRKKKPSDLFD